jgi:hypothetical protein
MELKGYEANKHQEGHNVLQILTKAILEKNWIWTNFHQIYSDTNAESHAKTGFFMPKAIQDNSDMNPNIWNNLMYQQ